MNNSETNVEVCCSVFAMLGVILTLLKVTNTVTMSWTVALAPLILLAIAFIIAGIIVIIDNPFKELTNTKESYDKPATVKRKRTTNSRAKKSTSKKS